MPEVVMMMMMMILMMVVVVVVMVMTMTKTTMMTAMMMMMLVVVVVAVVVVVVVTMMMARVVTKISSCWVLVVSSRGSRKQSWSPFPPPTPSPKKVLKCNFYRFRKGITAPKKQSSSRVQLSLAVL